MNESKQQTSKMSIGVDVSDKHSHVCVIDEQGAVIQETRIPTSQTAFTRFFAGLAPALVTFEVGTHSPWMDRLVGDLGHDVLVVNARKLELIAKNDSKNDRTDAELLARLRRADPKLLSPIQHRGQEAQADMELLRGRDVLVRTRGTLINHVRGVVKSMGCRLPKCSTEAFAQCVAAEIPKELRASIHPLLKHIKGLTEDIRRYDKKIEAVSAKRYPQTERLRQIQGVGPITSLCYVLVISDPQRFKNSRAVGSYLGLRPRQDESGLSRPELRITKAGDGYLRRLLVQGAHHILGPFGQDSDLRRWGLALADRGGKNAKKRAVVAVARKLAVLLHALLVSAQDYEPLRNAKRNRKGTAA